MNIPAMLTLYTSSRFIDHDTGPAHPESPGRIRAILDLLGREPYASLRRIEARPAERASIERAHPARYVDLIEEAAPAFGLTPLDSDTVMSPGSLEAALLAAGAVCMAVGDVAAGRTETAFCAVRPPGHHAEPDKAMGFCLFNNVFIGARHAQEACGLRRVAIVDFDVHHGNGTDSMARHAEDILFVSSHQWPLYPGTGDPKDNIEGKILNMTLAAGDGGEVFRKLYRETALPALDSFAPDLVMISAGFDAHRDDPLGGLNLTEDDFSWITRELKAIARKHARGRIVSVLEGGYNLEALKSAASAHLDALQAL